MKPIISNTDYHALKSFISGHHTNLNIREISGLKAELDNARVVKDEEIDNHVIRLNSYIEVEDTATKKIWKMTLTLPHERNIQEQKISVLSPLGVALIGYKEGMTIKSSFLGGLKTLKVLKVSNNTSV